MSKTIISFYTNTNVKNKAKAITNKFGISLSTLLNAYLHQICFQHRIPFQIAVPNHVKTDTSKDIQKRANDFAKGDLGKKHHLIY